MDNNAIVFSDRVLSMSDTEGQYDMARGLEVQVEKCQHCEYAEEPTFKEERRIAYRQVGEPKDYAYSRSISCAQEVLVCLNCGEVHRVLNEAF